MRRIATIAILGLGLAASACGADESRLRSVEVSISVVDGRDASGIEVAATGYATERQERVRVDLSDGSGDTGVDCDEVEAAAARRAEALGLEMGPCEPYVADLRVVADRTATTTDADGVAVLHLLPDMRYEVWAAVEIVPGDGSSCTWNGTGSIDETSTAPIEVHLDSDGCSGG